MRHSIIQLLLSAGLACSGNLVNAHHSTAVYDMAQDIILEGVVVRYEWANPHVYLWLETQDGSDARTTWEIEGQPPAILKRLGWTAETVKIGERLKINAKPGRNQNNAIALMQTLEKADNTVLAMDRRTVVTSLSSGTATTFSGNGLEGVWTTIMDLPTLAPLMDRNALSLTEAARNYSDAFLETEDSPSLNCIPFVPPVSMLTPDTKEIRVSGNTLYIRGEFDGTERVVYLEGSENVDPVTALMGHSVGRWEDSTLVIETTHFAEHPAGITYGVPSSPEKRMVERLTPNAAGTHLTYAFELHDPISLETPVTGTTTQWQYRPDIAFELLPCNLENARRFIR